VNERELWLLRLTLKEKEWSRLLVCRGQLTKTPFDGLKSDCDSNVGELRPKLRVEDGEVGMSMGALRSVILVMIKER